MPVYYIIILLSLTILLLAVFAVNTYLKYIRLKVQSTPDALKLERLNSLLLPYGFQYDPMADYFYSTVQCWQREYGYHRLYDSSAAAFGMIFHCEPVYFDYGGRHWLIEFWKGQYGMSAGTEVGIYTADSDSALTKEPQDKHYKSIDDSELFPIRINLFHDGELMAIREEKHWWLTAFFLGRYCPPDTLTAKISITFPDYEMCNAYIDGLKRAGYAPSAISRYLRTVAVPFTLPRTRQPVSQRSAAAKIRLCLDRFCCFLYRQLTRGYTCTLDRLEFLSSLSPVLLKLALRFARTRKRYLSHHGYRRGKEAFHVHRKPIK